MICVFEYAADASQGSLCEMQLLTWESYMEP